MITVTFGTVASEVAYSILAPCRMIPSFSTCEPTRKPGTSIRYTSATLKASHMRMERAALSAESESSAPPFCIGWFATTPTEWPPARAKPITMFFAHVGLISNHDSASKIALMTFLTSYAARWLTGTIFSRPATRRSAGSAVAPSGGGDQVLRRPQETEPLPRWWQPALRFTHCFPPHQSLYLHRAPPPYLSLP